jgi:HlyD family secretion protein
VLFRSLIDDRCFYVSAPIDEVDAPAVAPDQVARVTLDAFGKRQFPGKVRRIAPYVLDLEKQARTVEVEVEIEAGGATPVTLLAGYSADVEIIVAREDSVLRIPTEAVMDDKQVYWFDAAAGLLHKRKIRAGLSNWEWTQVEEGLEAGQQVVVSLAQAGLGDGVAAVAAAKPGP